LRLVEIIDRIVEQGHLPDRRPPDVIKWSIENDLENNFKDYISAAKEENLQVDRVRDRGQQEIPVRRLENSAFFVFLANSYANRKLFDKALKIYEEMLAKETDESTVLNEYGATILNRMLHDGIVNKGNLDLARKLIFEAFAFDKKVAKDSYQYPAYKNLCFLRAMEAIYYHNEKDTFAAFVLGWMSVEMTIYRIWHQLLTVRGASGIDDLMRWNSDSIIEVLTISEVSEKLKRTRADLEVFRTLKNDLDTLKGIRNHLLHGDINNPTPGDSTCCINTALKLVPLFQSVRQDLEST
jgi:pentatricopeptide repeat protein